VVLVEELVTQHMDLLLLLLSRLSLGFLVAMDMETLEELTGVVAVLTQVVVEQVRLERMLHQTIMLVLVALEDSG
jgi:hypothetical protein